MEQNLLPTDLPICSKCGANFDYEQENGPYECQMCQIECTTDISEIVDLIQNGKKSEKYRIRCMRFPKCNTYPNGIVLQHDAFPAWNFPSNPTDCKLTECACNFIGRHAIWISRDVTKFKNCNGEVYIGTILDGPFKNGSTFKTN